MYNAEMKERFVSEFSHSASRQDAAIRLFNTLEPHELLWDADVCTRSKEELAPIMSEIVGFRAKSRALRLPILKSYARWCIRQGVPGACQGLLQIEEEEIGLEKLKHQTVSDPGHLQRYLDRICPKETEETVDCVYRCYYWLAFAGMKEEDALCVVSSEVDFQAMVIRHGGREYPIYPEAIPALENCVRLTRFKYEHPLYGSDKVVYKDREFGTLLLRGQRAHAASADNFSGETKSKTSIRVAMSKKTKAMAAPPDNEDLNLKLSFYRVQISGLFYRAYMAEQSGEAVDFMDAAGQFMKGRVYSLAHSRNLPAAKQRQLAKDYLEDYQRWKEAYSL